jgi:hypothetical protein
MPHMYYPLIKPTQFQPSGPPADDLIALLKKIEWNCDVKVITTSVAKSLADEWGYQGVIEGEPKAHELIEEYINAPAPGYPGYRDLQQLTDPIFRNCRNIDTYGEILESDAIQYLKNICKYGVEYNFTLGSDLHDNVQEFKDNVVPFMSIINTRIADEEKLGGLKDYTDSDLLITGFARLLNNLIEECEHFGTNAKDGPKHVEQIMGVSWLKKKMQRFK